MFKNPYATVEKLVDEISFAERLKYFMKFRNISAKDIDNLLGSEECPDYREFSRTVRGYLAGEHEPTLKSKETLARILDIHIDHLNDDLGRYYRGLAVINEYEEGYRGEPIDRNGDFCLHGYYEFDGWSTEESKIFDFKNSARFNDELPILTTSEVMELESIDEEDKINLGFVLECCDTLELLTLFKFATYIDEYMSIGDEEWQVLMNFAHLEIENRNEILVFLQDLLKLKDFSDIEFENDDEKLKMLNEMRLLDNKTVIEKIDQSLKLHGSDKRLRNDLSMKLNEYLSPSYMLDRLKDRIEIATTMDNEDWHLLIFIHLIMSKRILKRDYLIDLLDFKIFKIIEKK